jgi:hypothetical protein
MSGNKSGIVYILSNPAMPGLVKIGLTTRENLDDRMQELFTTSVPVPFECEFACVVDDCVSVEKALHIAFSPNRINPQREFFKIEPEQAMVILKLLQKQDITPSVNEEINKSSSLIDKEAGALLKKQRRPPLNFVEMGIPIGSKIQFNNEEEIIEATIISEKKVKYDEAEYSLTKLTRELLDIDHDVQPTRYWTFEGKILTDYYDKTYSEVE